MTYRRILIKISGEALMGEGDFGIALDTVDRIAGDLKEVWEQGYEVAGVVGGGNIFRGLSAAAKGMERATAD